MAKPHIPSMADIKSLANEEIRFYALAGAIMSLAAGLELSYFDLFERVTKINRDTAARFFYLIMNASTHRDMANVAVSDALVGNPLLAEWTALYKRIVTITGQSSDRNLLGHAVIRQDIRVKQGPIMSSGFLGLTETTISYHVEQDAALLLSGRHKARTVDFDSLSIYCDELIAVLSDLDVFLGKLP